MATSAKSVARSSGVLVVVYGAVVEDFLDAVVALVSNLQHNLDKIMIAKKN